jgi:hypothetical protein
VRIIPYEKPNPEREKKLVLKVKIFKPSFNIVIWPREEKYQSLLQIVYNSLVCYGDIASLPAGLFSTPVKLSDFPH